MNNKPNQLKDNKVVLVIGTVVLTVVVFFGVSFALDQFSGSNLEERPPEPTALQFDSRYIFTPLVGVNFFIRTLISFVRLVVI